MKTLKSYLKLLIFAGNIILILWIFYDGFNESFGKTLIKKTSYFLLIGGLIANGFRLFNRIKGNNDPDLDKSTHKR
jgi:hypothetical protein